MTTLSVMKDAPSLVFGVELDGLAFGYFAFDNNPTCIAITGGYGNVLIARCCLDDEIFTEFVIAMNGTARYRENTGQDSNLDFDIGTHAKTNGCISFIKANFNAVGDNSLQENPRRTHAGN